MSLTTSLLDLTTAYTALLPPLTTTAAGGRATKKNVSHRPRSTTLPSFHNLTPPKNRQHRYRPTPQLEVLAISFSFLSSEDVRSISVKQIDNPTLRDNLNMSSRGGL